jgi:HAD superfamily hydrolase (TIGR01490 family)
LVSNGANDNAGIPDTAGRVAAEGGDGSVTGGGSADSGRTRGKAAATERADAPNQVEWAEISAAGRGSAAGKATATAAVAAEPSASAEPSAATGPSAAGEAVAAAERITVTERVAAPQIAAPRVAAFFDLDKTIIASSSTLAFGRPLYRGGLINRRAALRTAYAQLMFFQSGSDAEQVERMRAHLTALCQGWDVEQVRSIVEETLHDIVDPLVYAEAAELIGDHRAKGHDVVVVSASGEEMVAPIAALVGATHSAATRMAVVDGRYTGEIDFYCYGDEKAVAMRELAAANGYDLAECYAYTDSITDLPMLEVVGHPAAVNPNRALKKVAAQRGWPVLAFTDPVPLRAKIATPAGGMVVAATAVGLGAVAAGMTWYGLRRRRNR